MAVPPRPGRESTHPFEAGPDTTPPVPRPLPDRGNRGGTLAVLTILALIAVVALIALL